MVPDVGLAPPPPPDVSAQLRPSAPAGGGAGPAPDLASILQTLAGNGPPPMDPDLTPMIQGVQPLLTQLARQVPALGPDVDRLNVELSSRMGGLPNAMAGMAAQGQPSPGGLPSPGVAPTGLGPAPGPAPIPTQSGLPSPMPAAPGPASAMDTAMQLEVKLPSLGTEDPTLMPYIQGFIARMRDEVPKVVNGETENTSPPTQVAPTDSMLSKIPVAY